MLIKCPECELQVSDKALSCPHCGYPLKPTTKYKSSSNKHRRLPNGFGQISEIKNQNLRNRYRAMVTVGKTEEGKPITRMLKPKAYFATYNEAYEALVEYNKNPYNLDNVITVEELYERWSEEYFKTLKSKSSERTITSAWKYCSSIYSLNIKELRARHIKGCIDHGKVGEKEASAGIKARIKSLFNLMLDYAVEYELIERNYARTFDLSEDIVRERESTKRDHLAFQKWEIDRLWEYAYRMPYVDVVLIQCYSGWRPQELGKIRLDRVNIKDWTFTGGMKTKAGIDRLVPIHPKIQDLVLRKYKEAEELGSEYLINCTDTKTHQGLAFTYDKYRARFNKIRDSLCLDPNHRPHDGRKHFITMCKKYNVDEYAIKYMAGHEISDVTEKVYTERDVEWLRKELEKIK